MTANISIPKWQRFEQQFNSVAAYDNPVQEAQLTVTFRSPSGAVRTIEGFWDGGAVWRVRFKPDEVGTWHYRTACSDAANEGLQDQTGSFLCGEPEGETRFNQHGPLRLAGNRRYLVHADGTPFFWLADTAWSGPLLSTDEEWESYIRERTRQKFTAVQWMATQTLAMPEGDINRRLAFHGRDRIGLNPVFFQRLDEKLEALNQAGLLGIPVLLWTAEWGKAEINALNPGYDLPEDQAILLARYMVVRWGAHDVVWILPGDGDYSGQKAECWKRIGRAVFGTEPHTPVSLHPRGMHLPLEEFRGEEWLDINGYQSGHGDDEPTLAWIVAGPLAKGWTEEPIRPFINLEPPYENHVAYQSRQPFDAYKVRRAIYWSLLVAPTAGVSYGGHGVWGWDDGTRPPTNHPNTGIPLPWQQALLMPAAEQMAHLFDLFQSIDWPRLRPAPELVADQPGQQMPSRTITASRSDKGDLALVYIPQERTIQLNLSGLQPNLPATWFDPRTGKRHPAAQTGDQFETPAPGDWVLVFQ